MAAKRRPSLPDLGEVSVLEDLDAFLEEEEEEDDEVQSEYESPRTSLPQIELGGCCAVCQTPANSSPAMIALSNGHTTCLQEILRAQSELEVCSVVDDNGATLAHIASRKGDLDSLRVILEADRSLCDIGDSKGATPLHVCAYHGHVECLRCLLSEGRSGLLRDKDGATAVHFASASGHTECLRVLLEEGGGDPNEQTNSGETPGIPLREDSL